MDEQISMYRVEVSGWDLNEQFFVERTALQWGRGESRMVLIRQKVRTGALVFVRLLENAAAPRSFPVAYRARQVVERENGALYELMLNQVWPAAETAGSGATTMFEAANGSALGLN
ncbi:MAG TPA: hypothetical protein VMI93_07140 [Candidatus Solibacter sp.]|nr:hypothetical protein [Candidatus Solibacter sp.]